MDKDSVNINKLEAIEPKIRIIEPLPKSEEPINLDEIKTVGYYQVDKEINIKPIFPPKVTVSYIDTKYVDNSSIKIAEECDKISGQLICGVPHHSIGPTNIKPQDFDFIGNNDPSAIREDIEKHGIIFTSTPKGIGYFDVLSVSNRIKSQTPEMLKSEFKSEFNPFLSGCGDLSMMLDFLIKESMTELDLISVDYEKWKSDIIEVWKSTIYLPRKQKKRVRKELLNDWNNACQGNKLQIKYFSDILNK